MGAQQGGIITPSYFFMKVVLDTNVLISALLWKGRLSQIYLLINKQKIILCFSKATLEELIRVLHYPRIATKVQKEAVDIDEIIRALVSSSIIVQPSRVPRAIEEDAFDNHFLACALAAQADFIISGDAHLLKLKTFQGVTIVSPQEFLKEKKRNHSKPTIQKTLNPKP